MTPDEFSALAHFLKRRSGIALGADKRAQTARKLAPVIARFGFKTVSELVRELTQPGDALARDVVGALTTNETSFFRDRAVFQYFRENILPALLHARLYERRIRIWCAGASTGQEPYSLAMIVDEFRLLLKGWTVEIVASDIAADAIARARDGVYSAEEVERGLSPEMLARYFYRHGNMFEVARVLRDHVRFEVRNLMEPFAALGAFDVVFCRNVLIYFDASTKQNLLNRLRGVLAADGHLILGSAETLMGFGGAFETVAPGIYAPGRGSVRKLATG